MTKPSITVWKSENCDVCQDMKTEIENLKKDCPTCTIRVIDVDKKPSTADREKIRKIPAIDIKTSSGKKRRFIGRMTSKEIIAKAKE